MAPDVCLGYGFNPSVLTCSTCDQLQQVLGEQSDISARCYACCLEVSVNQEERYARAVLELDKRSLGFFAELQAVVKIKKELGLTVKYEFVNPRLLMYKASTDLEAAEEISVRSWGVDTFRDYLQTHLLHAPAPQPST